MTTKNEEETIKSLETSDSLPEALKEEKNIKTKVTNMSTLIEEKLMQLKDLATLEVMLDVHIRMKKRLESIKKTSSAEHLKIRGHWKTISPQIHISNLQGKKVNNDEVEITFGVYDVDKKGNKKECKNYGDVEQQDGKVIKKHLSSEYRIKYEVTEKIKSGKPITREIMEIDRAEV